MELPLFSLSVFSTLLLFFLMVVKLKSMSRSRRNSKLPPGPWKLPIIGNLHQMTGALPHHTLRYLSNTYGPLMHLQLGELSTVVISSREMAVEVLKKQDAAFASRPKILTADVMVYNQTDIAFAPYGAYWRQLRKICTSELLTSARVKSFQYVREEEISDFTKSISLSAEEPVNLTSRIFSLGGSIISRTAFGKKSDEQDQFLSIIEEGLELLGGFAVADLFPSIEWLATITGMKGKLERLHNKADKLLENIINEHKQKNISGGEAVEDLVDVLLKYTDGGANTEFQLTIDNIKAVIVNMFTAGADTSSTTVEWAMTELIKNPSLMAKAQAEVRRVFHVKGKVDEADFHELHYLKFVIKEILRLHPPLPLLAPRESILKSEINGYEIPVKTKVIVNAWALGRDPNYWNDPDTFSPERFQDCSTDYKGTSFEFIPFGAGRRICPGILSGMTTVELILAELLYHFDWKLPDGMKHGDLDMTEKFGAAVKRKQDLVLIPVAHPK